MELRFPLYQIEQTNLGFDAMLGDAHEERAEKVLGSHIGRSLERSGILPMAKSARNTISQQNRRPNQTHEVQYGGPSRNFIRFGWSDHTK
jgi:hypothetical protein